MQQACSFVRESHPEVTTQYLLYLPQSYDPASGQTWPLILFLHGAAERGSNLRLVKRHGPPKLVEHEANFPFIVVSPQCPAGQWWSREVLEALLDDVTARYSVDPDRVYATGLSMGGFGTWGLAIAQPDRFAAIAPICGGGVPAQVCAIAHLPVWAFHGAKDDVVPLHRSVEMVDALQACGGDVRLTVYPEARHDSWTETYANPELYTWFLAHRRG